MPIILSTFDAILRLIGVISKVLAANCVGVIYIIVLSAMLTLRDIFFSTSSVFAFWFINLVISDVSDFEPILFKISLGSNIIDANCVGVIYFIMLSATFNFVAILSFIGLILNVFAAN